MSREVQKNSIKLDQFDYPLPQNRIASYPLPIRDLSRLLVADPQTETIIHDRFYNVHRYIPENAVLIRNRSKVIRARLFLRKLTGGKVEVFCLEPLHWNSAKESSSEIWKCLIRGKKVKVGDLLKLSEHSAFSAEILQREGAVAIIQFSGFQENSFFKFLEKHGHVPIPPYLHREDQPIDARRYQTVYADIEGSVAAPTAGLHFTKRVLNRLEQECNVQFLDIILHVSGGTFLPVKTDDISKHVMHYEMGIVDIGFLRAYKRALEDKKTIVAVGTTSLRMLESLYWIGVKLKSCELDTQEFIVHQDDPLQYGFRHSLADAITALVEWCSRNKKEHIRLKTQLFIFPGYEIQTVDGLITNFHQPKSTLLLLVAAFVGDFWRQIYTEALNKGYRFLSYGDSSLLWRLTKSG